MREVDARVDDRQRLSRPRRLGAIEPDERDPPFLSHHRIPEVAGDVERLIRLDLADEAGAHEARKHV
jgi:hypothetical protein